MIIVNGFQPLTIITKHSILNVAAALDPPLLIFSRSEVEEEEEDLHDLDSLQESYFGEEGQKDRESTFKKSKEEMQ